MRKNSILNVILVGAGVCIVCSTVVSTAAVALKDIIERNRVLEQRRNILVAAGVIAPGETADVNELFQQKITPKIVDLHSGQWVDDVDPATFDARKAAKDPKTSEKLPEAEDIAGLKRIAKYREVYLYEQNGQLKRLVLPVRGMGLWSTMRGFVALAADLNTIENLSFYEHGETPGLGGEIDNPRWRQKWKGKKAFDKQGDVEIRVVKGTVNPSSPESIYEVDVLSGATITSRGVTNLLHFWLGQQGYGPLIDRLRDEARPPKVAAVEFKRDEP